MSTHIPVQKSASKCFNMKRYLPLSLLYILETVRRNIRTFSKARNHTATATGQSPSRQGAVGTAGLPLPYSWQLELVDPIQGQMELVTTLHPVSAKFTLILSSHLIRSLSHGGLPFRCFDLNATRISYFPHVVPISTCHAPGKLAKNNTTKWLTCNGYVELTS
jgi:hypothetical protein